MISNLIKIVFLILLILGGITVILPLTDSLGNKNFSNNGNNYGSSSINQGYSGNNQVRNDSEKLMIEALITKINDFEEELGKSQSKHKEFIVILNDSIEDLRKMTESSAKSWIDVFQIKKNKTEERLVEFECMIKVSGKMGEIFKNIENTSDSYKSASRRINLIDDSNFSLEFRNALKSISKAMIRFAEYLEYHESGQSSIESFVRGYYGDTSFIKDLQDLDKKANSDYCNSVDEYMEVWEKYLPDE